jgi:hypothetical protein
VTSDLAGDRVDHICYPSTHTDGSAGNGANYADPNYQLTALRSDGISSCEDFIMMNRRLIVLAGAAFLAVVASGCSSNHSAPANDNVDGGQDADGGIGADGGGGQDSCTGQADSGVCAPAPLPACFPPPLVPANRVVGACSLTQIQSYVDSCSGARGGTPQKCQSFGNNNTSCANCLITTSPQSASSWGPIVVQNGLIHYDYGACIALLDPSQLDCAKKAEAALQCLWVACAANCPVTNAASLQAYSDCFNQVSGGECKQLIDSAFACESSIPSSSPAIACFGPNGVQNNYGSGGGGDGPMKALATIFCGN